MTVSHVVLLSGSVPLPLMSSSRKRVVIMGRSFVIAIITADIRTGNSLNTLIGSSTADVYTGA